jgi:hypothetical protein
MNSISYYGKKWQYISKLRNILKISKQGPWRAAAPRQSNVNIFNSINVDTVKNAVSVTAPCHQIF